MLLAGATGLVGGECLRLLLADEAFDRVVVLSRRPLPEIKQTSKLHVHVVDFDNLHTSSGLFHVDAVLCALGTTIKQAGSREQFRRVDYGYPLEMARLGVEQGARHFLLVSALGANARSRLFYNRVKGELEEAVTALPYPSLTITRPSLLLGNREDSRRGEEAAKRFGFLLPGKLKPVRAGAVAAALVQAAKEEQPGRRIFESAEIRRQHPV